jgi:hypothetical protein
LPLNPSGIFVGLNEKKIPGSEKHTHIMNKDIPPAIEAFFRAHNTGQTDDIGELAIGT